MNFEQTAQQQSRLGFAAESLITFLPGISSQQNMGQHAVSSAVPTVSVGTFKEVALSFILAQHWSSVWFPSLVWQKLQDKESRGGFLRVTAVSKINQKKKDLQLLFQLYTFECSTQTAYFKLKLMLKPSDYSLTWAEADFLHIFDLWLSLCMVENFYGKMIVDSVSL